MSLLRNYLDASLLQETFLLRSAEETFTLGKTLGSSLRSGSVLALTGDLGAGKTTFVKGLAMALGIDDPHIINSPTFTYVNVYEGKLPLYHFDLYRLRSPQEFLDSGFVEFLHSGIACIEWPEHALPFLPSDTLFLTFTHVDPHTRSIRLEHMKKDKSSE